MRDGGIMTVRKINDLHRLEYKSAVDEMVRTAENTLPDSIERFAIFSFVDFQEAYANWISVGFFIHVEGMIPNTDGTYKLVKQRFGFNVTLDEFRLNDESYIEFVKNTMVSDLADIILHIIRFIKTGEIGKDEITGEPKRLL